MTDADQGQLDQDVEKGAERLEKAADLIYQAVIEAGEAEAKYKAAEMTELKRLEIEQDGKMPASDLRQARIFPKLSEEFYTYVHTKTKQEALEKSTRLHAAVLNARQSLLKARGPYG